MHKFIDRTNTTTVSSPSQEKRSKLVYYMSLF